MFFSNRNLLTSLVCVFLEIWQIKSAVKLATFSPTSTLQYTLFRPSIPWLMSFPLRAKLSSNLPSVSAPKLPDVRKSTQWSIFALGRLVSGSVRRSHCLTRSFRVPSSSTASPRVSFLRPGSLRVSSSSPIASLQTRYLPHRAFSIASKKADIDTSRFFEYTSGRWM